jgi:hypothetical protein
MSQTYSGSRVSDGALRIAEVKVFWKCSSRAMAICARPLTDKAYKELTDLRDDLDLIADRTEQADLKLKALDRIALIDAAVEKSKTLNSHGKQTVSIGATG